MRTYEMHASAKQVQRSSGRSSVAAAAYRSASRLIDERTGLAHDYTRKGGVEHSRIYVPDHAPEWAKNREQLWNEVEKKENRSNSMTAREFEVAFPAEFNAMQRREAGHNISQELMRRFGGAVDISYHQPHRDGDQRNFHAHILYTTRGFDDATKDGWSKSKYRDWSQDKITTPEGEQSTRSKQTMLELRSFTATEMNRIAERERLEVKTEHLSFEARGIDREPTQHRGATADKIEREGKQSERGDFNRAIQAANDNRQQLIDRQKVVLIERERLKLIAAQWISDNEERIPIHEKTTGEIASEQRELAREPLSDVQRWSDAVFRGRRGGHAGDLLSHKAQRHSGQHSELQSLREQGRGAGTQGREGSQTGKESSRDRAHLKRESERLGAETAARFKAQERKVKTEDVNRIEMLASEHQHFTYQKETIEKAREDLRLARHALSESSMMDKLTGKRRALESDMEAKEKNLENAALRMTDLIKSRDLENSAARHLAYEVATERAELKMKALYERGEASKRFEQEKAEMVALEHSLSHQSNVARIIGVMTGRTKEQAARIEALKQSTQDYEMKQKQEQEFRREQAFEQGKQDARNRAEQEKKDFAELAEKSPLQRNEEIEKDERRKQLGYDIEFSNAAQEVSTQLNAREDFNYSQVHGQSVEQALQDAQSRDMEASRQSGHDEYPEEIETELERQLWDQMQEEKAQAQEIELGQDVSRDDGIENS